MIVQVYNYESPEDSKVKHLLKSLSALDSIVLLKLCFTLYSEQPYLCLH